MDCKQQHSQCGGIRRRHFSKAEIDYFLNHYHYDPQTGEITLSNGHVCKCRIGDYIQVHTPICVITGHQLAWILYYHRQPVYTIDHINRHGRDNRIKNLRDVTLTENNRNRVFGRRTCFKSVTARNDEGVFSTYMDHRSKTVWRFATIDEAVVFRIRHGLEI